MKTDILIIIPARGGSKGIPRKNLRMLGGKPLIFYSITAALKSRYQPDVYVSTDDQEIKNISEKIGALTIERNEKLANDSSTLDPVIFHALNKIQTEREKRYKLIVTLQPTSPLLKYETLDEAIQMMVENEELDTLISAANDTHLRWKKSGDGFLPAYEKRVNRQYLPPTYKETGGFLITRNTIIKSDTRIGKSVKLFILHDEQSIDIDTFEDWNLCEYHLQRKKVLIVVSGNYVIGLGHVYNTLLLVNDILNHDIEFLVDKKSDLAYEKILQKNYKVSIQKCFNLVDDIAKISPDVVINDMLDTSLEYVTKLKNLGCKVINFEDLGQGARYADLVINAIYPEQKALPGHYFGKEYFLIRDEFLLTNPRKISKEVKSILITFGGVDPNNFTRKVLDSIFSYCDSIGIELNVVAGFGYEKYETLEKFSKIKIHKNVSNISEYMKKADVIFTSAGRTTYEIASLNVPAIVLAQNDRELTHFFSGVKNGFVNLGLGVAVSENEILNTLKELVGSYSQRLHMSKLMSKCDLKTGRKRVLKLIKKALE